MRIKAFDKMCSQSAQEEMYERYLGYFTFDDKIVMVGKYRCQKNPIQVAGMVCNNDGSLCWQVKQA
jgi:hypothetical protein